LCRDESTVLNAEVKNSVAVAMEHFFFKPDPAVQFFSVSDQSHITSPVFLSVYKSVILLVVMVVI